MYQEHIRKLEDGSMELTVTDRGRTQIVITALTRAGLTSKLVKWMYGNKQGMVQSIYSLRQKSISDLDLNSKMVIGRKD